MPPRTFDSRSVAASSARAAREFPNTRFAAVTVKVIDTRGTTVTLEAATKPEDPRGKARFDCEWGKDMWTDCPSTLSGPTKGEEGVLYLAGSVVKQHSLNGTPKWPDAKDLDLGPDPIVS